MALWISTLKEVVSLCCANHKYAALLVQLQHKKMEQKQPYERVMGSEDLSHVNLFCV